MIPGFSLDLEVSPGPGRTTGHCGACWQTPPRPPSGLTPSRYGDPGVFIRPACSSMRLRNEIELCGFFQRHSSSIRPSNPGRTLSKIGHPLRSRKAAPACAKQNGYCCARPPPLRTAFAHGLCASSLSNISFVNLRFGIVRGRFQCCTRGGQNGGSDPPVCALRAALTPGCIAHHVGQCRSPYGGVAPAIVILAGRLGLRRTEAA